MVVSRVRLPATHENRQQNGSIQETDEKSWPMTQRDFEAIANTIHAELDVIGELESEAGRIYAFETLTAVTHGIAMHAKETNSRFDRDRFFKACGFSASLAEPTKV